MQSVISADYFILKSEVKKLFRECYFEYAGVSSQSYNLMLAYASNSNEDFDSGGKFDTKTDTLPRSHETLLYGKDYSAQPLSFDVEIINPDAHIPFEQFIEIKNWLFEQDGWKTFRCLDDRQDYLLKCIFEPGEDIVDGDGYTGLRCTLKNVSPFWYGREYEYTKTSDGNAFIISGTVSQNRHVFSVDIPRGEAVDRIIYPEVAVGINRAHNGSNNYAYNNGKIFILETSDASTVAQGLEVNNSKFVYPATSRVYVDTTSSVAAESTWQYSCTLDSNTNKYIIQLSSNGTNMTLYTDYTEQPTNAQIYSILNANGYYGAATGDATPSGHAVYAKDEITISTKGAYAKSQRHPDVVLPTYIDPIDPQPLLRLHYGVNVLRVYYPWAIDYVTIKCTPLYRVGAF